MKNKLAEDKTILKRNKKINRRTTKFSNDTVLPITIGPPNKKTYKKGTCEIVISIQMSTTRRSGSM